MTVETTADSRIDKSLTGGLSAILPEGDTTFQQPTGVAITGPDGREDSDNGETEKVSFTDQNGNSLSGTITIFKGQNPVFQFNTDGSSQLPGVVPAAVTLGENKSSADTYNLIFEPSIVAVDFVAEAYLQNPVGPVQYGSIEGTLTDADGDPVGDDTIEGAGLTVTTNEDGFYTLLGPGGTETTLTVAGSSQNVTIVGGETEVKDFSYSRLIVRVLSPRKKPVVGTKVKINGKSYRTDDRGEAIVPLAEVKDYLINIGGFSTEVSIKQQGEILRETVGDGSAGVEIEVSDSSSGESVGGTTVEIQGSGITARTNNDGVASSITDEAGEKVVLIGNGDKRYAKEVIEGELVSGEVIQADIELTRKNNTPTL